MSRHDGIKHHLPTYAVRRQRVSVPEFKCISFRVQERAMIDA